MDIKNNQENWIELCKKATSITLESFWYVMQEWSKNPKFLMKPIKNYSLSNFKEYDRNNHLVQERGENIEQLEFENEHDSNVAKRVYTRVLIPRIPEKDNTIEEIVTHYLFQTPNNGSSSTNNNMNNNDNNNTNNNNNNNTNISRNLWGRVEFSPVVAIENMSNPKYLPFFYPKVLGFALEYEGFGDDFFEDDQPRAFIKFEVIPFPNSTEKTDSPRNAQEYLSNIGKKVLDKLQKWGAGHESGYKKRVFHDQVVQKERYMNVYDRLKKKYKQWVEGWVDATGLDGSKHVFEDIAIASYLISLWEQERELVYKNNSQTKTSNSSNNINNSDNNNTNVQKENVKNHESLSTQNNNSNGNNNNSNDEINNENPCTQISNTTISEGGESSSNNTQSQNLEKKQTFVDLGCGNGFLVNILVSEGYDGFGIDLRARKTWEKFPEQIRSKLIEESLDPENVKYSVDWVIANHSDELTPWVSVIAAQNPTARFFVLPCCFWDFFQKFQGNDNRIGQYQTYLNYIELIGTKCGFKVERESLRIPSTRNVALIGKERVQFTEDEFLKIKEDLISNSKKQALLNNSTSTFQPRPKISAYVPQKRFKAGEFNPHLGIVMPESSNKKLKSTKKGKEEKGKGKNSDSNSNNEENYNKGGGDKDDNEGLQNLI